MSDPLIRYQLLKFCMNTLLSFLSRNVTPDNMATSSDDLAYIGPVHVDNKIVQEVLRAATDSTLRHANQLTQNWCKLKVQSPHHEGGYAITPTAASVLATFYSATSRFVTLLASLPHGGAWIHDGQVSQQALADHDTWSNPQLQALVQTHARLIQDYKCVERQLQGPYARASAALGNVLLLLSCGWAVDGREREREMRSKLPPRHITAHGSGRKQSASGLPC
jgi:hypothetical protein